MRHPGHLATAAILVGMAIGASGRHAGADETDTAAFQRFVTRLASERAQRVEDWWMVNLDDDPTLELVAVLCGESADDFVIQKDEGHRWDVRFTADGLTKPSCDSERPLDPRPENRHARWPKAWPSQGFDFYQGHRGGYDSVRLALRGGLPAIIRKEGLNDARDGDQVAVKDWDRLVHSGRARRYPRLPASGREGDEGLNLGLVIVPLAKP